MTGTMKHAKPEWRNPRSVGAHFFDRRNESKTTTRGTDATYINWDNLVVSWSVDLRWWGSGNGWKMRGVRMKGKRARRRIFGRKEKS